MKLSTLAAQTAIGILLSGPVLAQEKLPQNTQTTVKDRIDAAVATLAGNPLANADADMKHVLDALAELKPKPIEGLSSQEARRQPSPADAVKHILESQGKTATPDTSVATQDLTYKGASGEAIAARVYRPANAAATLPVVLYFHGGGWVIANLDTYDAAPRAMAKLANAIVVSVHYRQAPEAKFPAAHDDANAAYAWTLEQAKSWGGDPRKVAVMGESAGANLAINVALHARDAGMPAPIHQVLVYPVAGVDMQTSSYQENADAKPLNKPMMAWFVKHAIRSDADLQDPRIDLVGKADLSKLPGATVIMAQIDPLRSEGQALAEKLRVAGAAVDSKTYDGVTHEFFGMGAVVAKAQEAEMLAAADLKAAFENVDATGDISKPKQ